MTKEKLTEWLDTRVAIFTLVHSGCRLYDEPNENGVSEVFTYEYSLAQRDMMAIDNIQRVAEVLGVTLTVSKRDDDMYPTQLSFEYKGVTFYELSEKGADEFE